MSVTSNTAPNQTLSGIFRGEEQAGYRLSLGGAVIVQVGTATAGWILLILALSAFF